MLAIAEPKRREILHLVRDRELPAGLIAAHFGQVSRPAISQHLRVLREAGLVAERREGTHRYYRLQRDALLEARRAIEAFWDDSLDRLKAEAERQEQALRAEERP